VNELPAGWTWTTLGAIGVYLNGRGFKKSEWRESGRPIIRIQNLTGSGNSFNHFDGEPEEHYIARDGDLLVSWAATLGVFVWRGPEAVVNQHIFKVVSRIDRRFHRYLLLSTLDDLQRQTHGSGMVHITKSRFEETPVPLPPLHEQRRIVAAIEEHLSRLDAADASLAAALKRVGGIVPSLIEAALGEPWELRPLGGLLREPLRNGHSAKGTANGGVRTLTLTAVTKRDFSEENTKLTGADPARVAGLWLEPGDVLIERSNTPELVGTAALYKGPRNWAIFPDLLIRVRVGDALLPGFIDVVLRARRARRYFQSAAQGIAGSMPKIDQGAVERFEVPVPPLDEQRRIVSEVEERISAIAALGIAIERVQRRSASLRRAILERALRGELVPRDPTDEPASALLERIRAGRTTDPAGTRRRKVAS
jgi:type I restriction enzyme S subunit